MLIDPVAIGALKAAKTAYQIKTPQTGNPTDRRFWIDTKIIFGNSSRGMFYLPKVVNFDDLYKAFAPYKSPFIFWAKKVADETNPPTVESVIQDLLGYPPSA